MIRKVRLTNWRRHQSTSFTFEPGLNFVLGPNGSGKSSLLTGMRFGLFGVGQNTTSIRIGRRHATSDVTLSGTPDLVIGHAIDRSGRIEGSLKAGADAPIGTIDEILSARLGADVPFLDALLFLGEGEIYRYERQGSGVDLERQIFTILPVQELIRLRSIAEDLRSKLSKTLRTQRTELKASRDEIAALARDEERLAREVDEIERNVRKTRDRLRARQDESQLYKESQRQTAAHQAWNDEWTQFLTTLDPRLRTHIPAQLLATLQDDRRAEESRLHEARQSIGHATGRVEAINLYITALQDSQADTCPLCRQPLDAQHRGAALGSQMGEARAIEAHIIELKSEIEMLERTLTDIERQIEATQRHLEKWPGKALEETELPQQAFNDIPMLEEEVGRLQAAFGARREQLGEVRERLRAARQAQAISEEVTAAFRADTVLSIISDVTSEFLAAVMASVLEPIADELQRQWKGYRTDAELSLTLADEGRLALTDGESILPFSLLSGGEKMVSLMLLRIALVKALTAADFVVLDEPLEHLDARSRRLLISSLFQLVSRGILSQVIMSTYEESLVRRLVLRTQAHAVYVGSDGATGDSVPV
jgi:DNA repair exonuclease SbcCD ATPase subunit